MVKKAAVNVVAPLSQRLDLVGIDSIADDISNGRSLTDVAKGLKVSIGTLLAWIASSPERSARAREARVFAARIWDERAMSVIEEAGDPFELARAKEMAHHYRWRASKTAPKDFGDKLEVESNGTVTHLFETDQAVRMAQMLARKK